MENFKILNLLDKFQWIFEKMNIDYPIMRKIIQVKLTMDGRRQSLLNKNKKDSDKNLFFKNLWVYSIIGVFFIFLIIPNNAYFLRMSTIFSLIIFMLMLSLISDFSYILLDIKEKNIILTKPVDERTFSMAKILHISIYIFSLSLSLIGPSLVASLFIKGIVFFILYLIESILINLFSISFTVLLYFFVLKFFDGEKLKDIINYFQIILSIVMVVGYQVIGRVLNLFDVNSVIKLSWYYYLIPSSWFAAPFELFLNNSKQYIFLSLISLIVPLISIAIYIKLMKRFENNLQKLNGTATNKKLKTGVVEKIGNIICRDNSERASYKFANNMMRSEREIKLKLYPAIGFSIAFPFIMLFAFINDFSNMSNSKSYLTLYIAIPYLIMNINVLKTSVNYKASWIYNCAPIKNIKTQYKGIMKSFIIKFVIPVLLLELIIYISVYGINIIPDLISIFAVTILFVIYSFKSMNDEMPFSLSMADIQKQSGAQMLLIMSVTGLFCGIHYAFTFLMFGSFFFLFITLALNIITYKISFKLFN